MKSTSGGYPNIIVGLLGTLIGEEKRVGVAIFELTQLTAISGGG